jgi:hypothetical protein
VVVVVVVIAVVVVSYSTTDGQLHGLFSFEWEDDCKLWAWIHVEPEFSSWNRN